jgi:hypothetical protein
MGWPHIQRLPALHNQRSIPFYLAWATRLYTLGDSGFYLRYTADGRPMALQDAHFMKCLEVISGTWNRKLSEKP